MNNPYRLVIGRDGALWFCDLDNQRIRRLTWRTTHRSTDIAGNGQRTYAGDGGAATGGSLNMPHELAFDARATSTSPNGIITSSGKSTDGPASSPRWPVPGLPDSPVTAARRPPRAAAAAARIALGGDRRLLICDVGNHRIRAVDLSTGVIETIGGTGERRQRLTARH